MEKRIPYFNIGDATIEEVKKGERFILTSKEGEEVGALITLEELKLIKAYEAVENQIDGQAVRDAQQDEDLITWEEAKRSLPD